MASPELTVASQFDTAEQQHHASAFGMWVFLSTEIMLFGGLFAAYTAYRVLYPATFFEASRAMNITIGSINTVVLLVSSLAVALAVRSAQVGNQRALPRYLIITIVLGIVFLVLKAVEYEQHFADNLGPGPGFLFPGGDARLAQIYFLLYFGMTGLHALHLTIGIILMATLYVLARRGHFSPVYYTPVELGGLYWHLVDVIWVFLFPMFYLIGLHQP